MAMGCHTLSPSNFELETLNYRQSLGGHPVLLLAAAGLVGNGHLNESCFQHGIQDLVPELSSVGSACDSHESQ